MQHSISPTAVAGELKFSNAFCARDQRLSCCIHYSIKAKAPPREQRGENCWVRADSEWWIHLSSEKKLSSLFNVVLFRSLLPVRARWTPNISFWRAHRYVLNNIHAAHTTLSQIPCLVLIPPNILYVVSTMHINRVSSNTEPDAGKSFTPAPYARARTRVWGERACNEHVPREIRYFFFALCLLKGFLFAAVYIYMVTVYART